jgi:hypothetical protein
MTGKKIMAEIYMDPALLGRFQKDPKAVLKEKGLDVPGDLTLKVLVDTEKVRHIVLPYLGAEKMSSVEEVEQRLSKLGTLPFACPV